MMAQVYAALRTVHRHTRWVIEARAGSAAVIQTFLWRISLIFLNLINGIIVVRNLGPAGRGEQAVLMLWPQILPSILEFGIPFSVVYYARSRHEQRKSFYGVALTLSIGLSLLSLLVGYLGIPFWLARYGPTTIHHAELLMIFAPVSMFTFFILAIIDSEHQFSLSNVLRNVPTVLTTGMLIALLLSHKASPLSTALAYFVPSGLCLGIVGWIALRRYQPKLCEFRETTKLLAGYGMRVYGSTLIGTFGQQIDQLLVVGLLAPIDLGVYAVALSASRVLNIFPSSLLNVLLPKIVGRAREEVVDIVSTVARISFLCTAASGFVLAILLPFIMPRIFGTGLIAGVVVSQVLILEVIFSSTTWVLLQSYLALDRPAIVTVLQGIALALCIPLMLVLIPRLGLVGAAVALFASTLVRFSSAVVGYALVLKLPMPSLLVTKNDIIFLKNSVRSKLPAKNSA